MLGRGRIHKTTVQSRPNLWSSFSNFSKAYFLMVLISFWKSGDMVANVWYIVPFLSVGLFVCLHIVSINFVCKIHFRLCWFVSFHAGCRRRFKALPPGMCLCSCFRPADVPERWLSHLFGWDEDLRMNILGWGAHDVANFTSFILFNTQ